jgi:hypothetical protein
MYMSSTICKILNLISEGTWKVGMDWCNNLLNFQFSVKTWQKMSTFLFQFFYDS